jgi:hypothetical protein
MKRPQFLLVCAMTLASCRRNAASMPDPFDAVIGAWHRTSVAEIPPSATSGILPATSVERIRAATYEGPGKLEVRVYQLTSSAAALDAVQRWKPAPDTVFFYNDRFFVLIQWQTADRKALHEFVGALEKKFPVRQ